MPTIFFYGPELDKEKKKEMISSFTQTASKLTGIAESAFVVYLRPSGPENVGVGGNCSRNFRKGRSKFISTSIARGGSQHGRPFIFGPGHEYNARPQMLDRICKRGIIITMFIMSDVTNNK